MSEFVDKVMTNIDTLHEQESIVEEFINNNILSSDSIHYIKNNISKIQDSIKSQNIKAFLSIVKRVPIDPNIKINDVATKLVPDYKSNLKNSTKIINKEFGDVKPEYKDAMSKLLALVPKNKINLILNSVRKKIEFTKIEKVKIVLRIIIIAMMIISIIWYSNIVAVFGPDVLTAVGIVALVIHIIALIDIIREAKQRDLFSM